MRRSETGRTASFSPRQLTHHDTLPLILASPGRGLGILPLDLRNTVKDGKDHDLDTWILDETGVEPIQRLAAREPVLADVVVDPRRAISTNGEATGEDCWPCSN